MLYDLSKPPVRHETHYVVGVGYFVVPIHEPEKPTANEFIALAVLAADAR